MPWRSFPEQPVTRFAPSPTGYLHLGHVAHAIYVWGIARALGGTVLLRIEDHDRGRCKAQYEAAILEDLAWLGLEPDNVRLDDFAGKPSPFRQSDSEPSYRAALWALRKSAFVYGCECSRKAIAARVGVFGKELRYDGHCRQRELALDQGRIARVALDEEHIRFEDLLLGAQVQTPADQCGDLALVDRHGQWTYQFAVTVDDARQGVDLVMRGADLLQSTGRQIQLARMLGRTNAPAFAHHGLLTNAAGEKLSKRDFARSIRDWRSEGVQPEVVLGEAAARARLLPYAEPIAATELPALLREKVLAA